MRTHLIRSLIFLNILVAASTVRSNNWPSFRGPLGSGVGEGNPPAEWNIESGKNVAWKIPIEGLALSSPIVWEDRIFLTTAVGKDPNPKFEPDPSFGYGIQTETDEWQWKVICLDLATGRRLWERVAHKGVPTQGRHSESTHANPTPATDGTNVVAMFGSEGMFCYRTNGRLRWKRDLGLLKAGPEGHPDLQWGYGGSPVIHDGKAILQCDVQNGSFVVALNIESGEEVLRIERGDIPSWATPNTYSLEGRDYVVCNGFKNIAAYDLRSGEKVWWLQGKGDVPVPRPVLAEGLIFVTASHAGRSIYAIRRDARGNLTPGDEADRSVPGLAWWRDREGSYMPTPTTFEGILYVPNERGILSAYDPKTGERFYETRIVPGQGGPYYASPVAAGGKLYFTKNSGEVHVVRAGKQFERLATNEMGEPTMATPAILNGRLLIRTRSFLYCLSER